MPDCLWAPLHNIYGFLSKKVYAEEDFDRTDHYCLEVLWEQEDFNVTDSQG